VDDFQHRLLVALERLAGRGGPALDDRLLEVSNGLASLAASLGEVVTGQALVAQRLAQIRERLEDIRDRMPP
jgi:hypothetical protein